MAICPRCGRTLNRHGQHGEALSCFCGFEGIDESKLKGVKVQTDEEAQEEVKKFLQGLK